MDRQSFLQGTATKYNGERSSLAAWLATPQGEYVLQWELAQFDLATDDVFGFRAAQVGLPEYDVLRQNRIPFRFCVALERGAQVAADPIQLPFDSQSLDLLALPHALETHNEPHRMLREVERVLRPEGQVVISGFNTLSLWRAQQALWRMRARFSGGPLAAPWDANFIGLFKLRDWLRLLGLELNGGRFGCYAPPFRNARWIERSRFVEPTGDRWWPVLGAVYVVRAVKRVHGMRLVTPAWRRERARRRAVAAIPQRNGQATRAYAERHRPHDGRR
ncbi:MAG: methyltransferase domain-containing protein [Burkholderiales bacterium]|nr:methyltransferase domain-containing protein [Burkholderiales bacterium]